jgi:branched-chain amino acid transport system permease protein
LPALFFALVLALPRWACHRSGSRCSYVGLYAIVALGLVLLTGVAG